jgi:hypothetical protein
MPYLTRIPKCKQYETAININGVLVAVHAEGAVEVLIEAGGLPIAKVPRPATMKRSLVRAPNRGSTPSRGLGVDPD